MKRNLKLSLSILAWLICISLTAARKPSWVKQRPNDSKSYIGIGVATKDEKHLHTTIAQNQALKELCSEIKVTISANSVLRQFENNFDLKEEYETSIETSIAQTLQDYEVTTWEDKNQYWVMYKLSKEKYELNRRINLDKAKRTTWTAIEYARNSIKRYDYYTAIAQYIEATGYLENHINEDLTFRTFDGEINIGTTLFQDIQQLFKSIQIVPEKQKYSLPFTQQLRNPILIQVLSLQNVKPSITLQGIPLIAKQSYSPTPSHLISNSEGTATYILDHIESKRRVQELNIQLDMEAFNMSSIKNQALAKLYFNPTSIPQASVIIEFSKAKAWFNSQETIFEKGEQFTFNKQIKSTLSDNYFIFTTKQEEADYEVILQSDFIKGDEKIGNGYSVFIVYGSYHLAIIDLQNHIEIFSDSTDRIIGMQPGDYEHALKNCREKLSKQFSELTLPKLDQTDM